MGACLLALQVNCRDRRGLLSDVITALKSFPLEITTAAVTTTADGYVYDVFQVHLLYQMFIIAVLSLLCQGYR